MAGCPFTFVAGPCVGGCFVFRSSSRSHASADDVPGVFAYLEPGKPLLLLDLRKYADEPSAPVASNARRKHLRLAAVGVVAAGSLVATGIQVLPAAASPTVTKALESVALSLSPNGEISGISTTDITLDERGKYSSHTSAVDPAQAINRLPVVVTVGYVHDGKTGTNLNDLKKASGLVEVDVTVTNTSAHPKRYDVGAAGQSTYAQVATPLTVVASASMPKASITSLVSPQAGTATEHTTNGLISSGVGGKTVVQWASVLAPPRTGSTTTLTIVEQARAFVLPDLRISVTPGISADPSLEELMARAFGSDSPILALENATGTLVNDMSANLATVQTILDGVHKELLTEASSTGVRATSDLQASSQNAATALSQLTSGLTRTAQALHTGITDSKNRVVARVLGAFADLVDQVGLPDELPVTATPTATCAALGSQPAAGATLFEQLVHVTDLLRLAGAVNTSCVADMKATLLSTIGDATACPPAPATPSIACRLVSTRSSLSDIRSLITSSATQILSHLNGTGLSGIGTALTSTTAAVTTLQTDLATLSHGIGHTGDLATALSDAQDAVDQLLSDTSQTSGSGLGHELKALHDSAALALAAVGTAADGAGADTTQGALVKLTQQLCTLPTVDLADATLVSDYADSLRALIDGGTCAGGPAGTPPSSSLHARLAADRSSWQTVVDQTAVGATSGPAKELADVHAALLALKTTLSDAADGIDTTSPHAGSVAAQLAAVNDAADAIFDPTDPSPGCAGPQPGQVPLNVLAATFASVTCKQTAVADDLTTFISTTDNQLAGVDTAVADATDATSTAAEEASNQLDDALGRLTTRFSTTADDEQSAGIDALVDQDVALLQKTTASVDDVTKNMDAAVNAIDSAIRDANAQATANNDDLKRRLAEVVTHLGAPGSQGLLGKISHDGTSVKTDGIDKIHGVAATASGFGSVRDADEAGFRLQSRQFSDGLLTIGDTPYLGGNLPLNATHASVYTFQLAGH